MAETPLAKLVRVLGGVALSYGSLGHQVLGQLLTLNVKEIEIAAAATLITAGSRQKNALAYSAVRVLAPAIAVHLMTNREEKRLGAIWHQLELKEAALAVREAELQGRRAAAASARALRSSRAQTPRRTRTRGEP